MSSTDPVLKIAFIPFAAPGHMIPLMDIARMFARQGANVTFITTPANAIRFKQDVDSDSTLGFKIKLYTLQLPCAEVGLPSGLESFSQVTSWDTHMKLFNAFTMLQPQIEKLLLEMKADCIISDAIHTWTTDAAARLGITRLVFQCAGYITLSIEHSLRLHTPHHKLESDADPFIIPGLPHKLELTKSKLPFWVRDSQAITFVGRMLEAREKSHGILMNSFYELEPDYVQYYEAASGIKTWAIGPVPLWVNKHHVPSTDVGGNSNSKLIQWLNLQKPNSVVYVSFGSMTKFPDTQLLEIAHALEDSGHRFIWVIQKRNNKEEEDDDEEEGYLPNGFEERMKQGRKGLIIRNWAPQLLILNHPAIGGFVTQCGWNSVLESICAGQPIISWPLTAEQFDIEKLVIDVLKIGVAVGTKTWWDMNNPEVDLEIVKREQITKAISLLMGNDKEVSKMRERVTQLACAAKTATSPDGSSHASFMSLIDELKLIKLQRRSN